MSAGAFMIPTFIANTVTNLSEVCRLRGGKPVNGQPVLCEVPTTIVPNQASCYMGPNQAYWVPGRGCMTNLVAGCTTTNTFKKWYYEGDDIMCVADFNKNECAPSTRQGGNRVDSPTAGRSPATKNITIRQK